MAALEKGGRLASAIATVGALIAAFGGSLLLLEPPIRYPDVPQDRMATAIAVFAMLVLLLIIEAVAQRQPQRGRYWIFAAVASFVLFLGTSAYYLYAVPRTSFVYELADSRERFVLGDTYAARGLFLHRKFPYADGAELVTRVGGIDRINMVWTAESLNRTRFFLTTVYVAIVLFLATAVFSVVEGVFTTSRE